MRRRKIIWYRLLLVLLVPVVVMFGIIYCIYNCIDNKKDIAFKNMYSYNLFYNRFIDDGQQSITIEEFNDLILTLEEEKKPRMTYLGEFRLTGYCNCEDCNGVWAWGPTYSGVMPRSNHTIATDEDIIPMGTHVMINGIEYVAEDTGSAIIGNKIDVYVDTHEECYSDYCNGYADVYIIEEA